MTARTDSILDKNGTGRGKKIVTRPLTKKRGVNADRTKAITDNRAKYLDTSSVPLAEVGDHVDPNKPLTEKAKLFVKFWAQGESISSAAAKAGYGDGATYAYRLVRYPQAIALYNEEKRLYEEAAQMTRKKVMDMHLEAYEMARLMAEPATMVSAAREIGKMCGYYEPIKVQVSHALTHAKEEMQQLSNEDLMKLIVESAERAVAAAEDENDQGH